MDKFLYSRLTDTALPHIAVFLNDVQRKKTKRQNQYAISATFLPGHFKAYTVKLNALDGVYYCDIRPIPFERPRQRATLFQSSTFHRLRAQVSDLLNADTLAHLEQWQATG